MINQLCGLSIRIYHDSFQKQSSKISSSKRISVQRIRENENESIQKRRYLASHLQFYYLSMIESPIRKKHANYPKDFFPANPRPATHTQKFSFNESYQISAEVISKYSRSIDEEKSHQEKGPTAVTAVPNPQRASIIVAQIQEDLPLGHRSSAKKPNINAEILKKPRFSMKHDEEIPENNQTLQGSNTPGGIRKQLTDRQTPLPLEDPCRIELLQTGNKISKIPETYIKYRATGHSQEGKESRTWRSSEKEIVNKFAESRMKHSMNELPSVGKHPLNHSFNANAAKEVYDSFRKRQLSTAGGFGKINSFLMSLKREETKMEDPIGPAIPRFDPSVIQKLKEDINVITKSKRRSSNGQKKEQKASEHNQQSSEESKEEKQRNHKHKKRHTKPQNVKIPEFLVSYRSSLSYLKDLLARTSTLEQFRLTVKIPKLFTKELIYKNQQRSELYEISRSIFNELRIPNENLVIKRYTNCTMIISRNVCLIWHFDGKRYLGGWQTEYLDQGCKHGLGLEWQPKNYVYYGEFAKNRREGLGAFKDRSNTVYVGYWKKGKRYEQAQAEEQANEQQYTQQQEQEDDDPYANQDAYYEYL